jgi:protoporphyrinogen oxidase
MTTLANTTTNQSFAVIGGGVLGLTLADELTKAGQTVTVFEAAPEFGGLASAWELNGTVWDRHYHVTLLSDSHTRAVLKDLGLESDMKWVETRTGVYMDGTLRSISNSIEFLKFPPLSLVDKFRFAGTIAYAARVKDWKRLEKINVVDWLTKLSGKNVVEKMWRPLLRAKLGENYRHASAAFIWAIIGRLYAARRSGLKKELFGYLPGGYGRFFKAWADKLKADGVDLRCGARVASVRNDGRPTVALADGASHQFDRVLITAPSGPAADLIPQLTDAERQSLKNIRYQGIVCASVLLKKPLAGFYVTNLIDAWVPFTAVVEMSALVDRDHFGGNYLVYLPKYVDPADPLFDASDEQIRESFIGALLKMYPQISADDVITFKVSRVKRVLAITTIDYSAKLPPMQTSVPGVSVVNSAHILNGTLNVNDTIALAREYARRGSL